MIYTFKQWLIESTRTDTALSKLLEFIDAVPTWGGIYIEPPFIHELETFKIIIVDEQDYIKAFDYYKNSSYIIKVGVFWNLLLTLKNDQRLLDKNWGTVAGTYIAYRSGDIHNEPNGLFFAPDEESCRAYSKQDRNNVINGYKIKIVNPYVTESVYSALYELVGGTSPEQWHEKMSRLEYKMYKNQGTVSTSNADIHPSLAFDIRVRKIAEKKKYDSICYTNPPAPAIRELVIFDVSKIIEHIS